MNLFADENVHYRIVTRLRQDGHTVWSVAAMERGIPDVMVLHRANEEVTVLLTADTDFGELVFRDGRVTLGVVLLHLSRLSPESAAEVVASMIGEHATELPQAFVVITPGNIRVRRELP